MKLSELVSYHELLEKLTPENVSESTKKILGPVLHAVKSHDLQISDKTNELESKYHAVDAAFDSYLQIVGEIKSHVNQLILDQEPSYLAESYKLYEDMMDDSPDYVLARKFNTTEYITDFVHKRIQMYSNWKHPGMIIRPGHESWVGSMVASDPLYVVDTNYDLLNPAKQRFNDQYNQRVRWISIQESTEHLMLGSIPDSQIGFCVCYNFFHFKPFEIMKKYLEEIFEKMKPGGVVAITFNDCDRSGAVINTERFFMCYTPGRMVQSLCDSVGFEIVYSQHLDAAATWLELRKPGTLTSLRGGQSLAKVVAKSK